MFYNHWVFFVRIVRNLKLNIYFNLFLEIANELNFNHKIILKNDCTIKQCLFNGIKQIFFKRKGIIWVCNGINKFFLRCSCRTKFGFNILTKRKKNSFFLNKNFFFKPMHKLISSWIISYLRWTVLTKVKIIYIKYRNLSPKKKIWIILGGRVFILQLEKRKGDRKRIILIQLSSLSVKEINESRGNGLLFVWCTLLKSVHLLKIENNSSWVNFVHFREKTHFLALELFFIRSSWRV